MFPLISFNRNKTILYDGKEHFCNFLLLRKGHYFLRTHHIHHDLRVHDSDWGSREKIRNNYISFCVFMLLTMQRIIVDLHITEDLSDGGDWVWSIRCDNHIITLLSEQFSVTGQSLFRLNVEFVAQVCRETDKENPQKGHLCLQISNSINFNSLLYAILEICQFWSDKIIKRSKDVS